MPRIQPTAADTLFGKWPVPGFGNLPGAAGLAACATLARHSCKDANARHVDDQPTATRPNHPPRGDLDVLRRPSAAAA